MTLTTHASSRWAERLPGMGHPGASLGRARPVSYLAVVFAQRRAGYGWPPRDRVYRFDRTTKALWVLAADGAVVTVYPADVRAVAGAAG